MRRPLRGSRERREAQALQDALERFELAVSQGENPGQARTRAAADIGELRSTFLLATSMADAAADITPDPAFVRRLAMQIRETPVATPSAVRRRAPRFGFAPLAAAAAVVAAALVLIPSFTALPGEGLYAVKTAAGDARVWFARGATEARIRLALADERFEEVEQLIANSRVQVMGGPGILAAGVSIADIDDPELAKLIEGALRDAGEQLEAAAEILTEEPAPKEDLDTLVEVTTRGRALATDVAEELPNPEQPPVLRAAVKLAKIEAKAKAAQMTAAVEEPEPTLPPCPTPSASGATPTPSPEPTATVPEASPTLTPGVDESVPTATPTATPTAEPADETCVTPEPTPSPTPSATPVTGSSDAASVPTPTTSDDEQPTVDGTDDGEPSTVPVEPRGSTRRPPFDTSGEQA